MEVLSENGTMTAIITKEGIEKACLKENDLKFRQTQATPCMRESLRSDLGYMGLTPAAEAILDGTYQSPPGIPIYTREFLAHLKRETNQIEFPTLEINKGDFQQGWKKMKERTSSGKSGLHFGHLKTCTYSSFLSEFESSIAHIPFITGYSPHDWQTGINVMIQKKAMVDLVHKLRTIVLTEADFNFNNKLLGKRTLRHAEVNNLLPKEQYGSRKGKSAINHALHKRLTYDIMRQGRCDGVLCSNDAKSCYDRMIHLVVMLAYRRLGVPSPPVQSMLESIQNMTHIIRTSFGDSKVTISSKGTLIPYTGSLQGNGASPCSWVVVSAVLINMLRSAGKGGYFYSPISNMELHIIGFAFVDDTDLIEHKM